MQKEGNVGANAARDVVQRGIGTVDTPTLCQGDNDRRGIRRRTAKAGTQWDALLDRDADVGFATIMLGHSSGRTIRRILLHGKVGCRNRLDGQRLCRRDRHGIGKTDGCHQGIDLMVAAVVARGMNPQIEVDLCRRGKGQGPIGHR